VRCVVLGVWGGGNLLFFLYGFRFKLFYVFIFLFFFILFFVKKIGKGKWVQITVSEFFKRKI